MSSTYTISSTFTITHARHLSSKVAADMHLCAQYYRVPSEAAVRAYAEELAQLLNGGYVERYEFGFEREAKKVVCWRYNVSSTGLISTDDRAGKLVSTADVAGARFYNHLWTNAAWARLTDV